MAADANTVNIKSRRSLRAYHHGDLRDALVEAGMRLLELRTSERLGLREVAREVGVSPTAVYRHFPDKEALLRAIAERGFAMLGDMQLAAGPGTGKAAFGATGAAYVRFALANPAVFRLMFSSAPPRDLFSAPPEDLPRPMRLLRDHVASLMPADAAEPERTILSVRAWALVHGLAVLMLDHMVARDDALIDAVITGMPVG